MVYTRARRRGIGRALMLEAQAAARRHGRSTLVLDTRQGDPSEALYRSMGWTCAGVIPRYARSANGELHATALYYLCSTDDPGPLTLPSPPRGEGGRAEDAMTTDKYDWDAIVTASTSTCASARSRSA